MGAAPAPLAALAVVLGLAAAGCGGGQEPVPPVGGERAEPDPGRARAVEERVVRGWTAAVRAGEFERAGGYFAPRAIVEQGGAESRLRDRRAAAAFSAALPCRAKVTAVRSEGRGALATFALSDGAVQDCSGRARVRFVIRDGKIREWRQLPEPGEPPPPREPAPGQSAA